MRTAKGSIEKSEQVQTEDRGHYFGLDIKKSSKNGERQASRNAGWRELGK